MPIYRLTVSPGVGATDCGDGDRTPRHVELIIQTRVVSGLGPGQYERVQV